MEQFKANTVQAPAAPMVSSEEEFGRKYLYELITMPIRTPRETFRVRRAIIGSCEQWRRNSDALAGDGREV